MTPENKDNPLHLSWHDTAWVNMLNPQNIMDYFSEKSNPFYDRTCNNEIVKMQRVSSDQLVNMTGLEYVLLHVQEPILYVIRKQHRHSPQHTVTLGDYYVVAGTVYQTPDLGAVLNSRIMQSVNHLQSAFDEVLSYSCYHPNKGYWWDFKKDSQEGKDKAGSKKKEKEEPSSIFQRKRVDILLGELTKKFPFKAPPLEQAPVENIKQEDVKSDIIIKTEVLKEKTDSLNERVKPPPEKKPRLN